MEPMTQLRDDLAFVRRAVLRQQRMRRAILPWWFAGLVGVAILLRCIGIDHSPALLQWVRENPPLVFLAPLWVLHVWRTRRKLAARGESLDDEAPTRADVWAFAVPWVVLAIGYALLAAIATRLEIPDPLLVRFVVLLAGLASLHAGFAGSVSLLWVGAALEIGLLALVFLQHNAWTVFGSLVLAGLLAGSLHEERIRARA